MIIYFARHGESEANLLGEFSNRGSKHPLTEKGRLQAESLASNPDLIKAVRIYSSPLLRAVETAEILAEHLQIPMEITPALREFDVGILEGRSDEAGWADFRQVIRRWFDEDDKGARIPDGESFFDIQTRFMPFVNSVESLFAKSTAAEIILVSHGGLYLTMLPLMLENIDFSYARAHPIGNTQMVVAQGECGAWQALSWCGERFKFQTSPRMDPVPEDDDEQHS